MPKNKFQEIIFGLLMVFVMVYFMICYNISLATGGMSNYIFLAAFHELIIMMPIAFLLEFFIVGKLAKKVAFSIVDLKRDNPFFLVIMISVSTVWMMCPAMSFFATLLFKDAGSQFSAVWFHTIALNFPAALLWQLFFAGPLVRKVFGLIFNRNLQENHTPQSVCE